MAKPALVEVRQRDQDEKDRRAERMYRMGTGGYQELLRLQGGMCLLCFRTPRPGERFAVDHSHECCAKPPTCGNCTRALLCRPCNAWLGKWEAAQRAS